MKRLTVLLFPALAAVLFAQDPDAPSPGEIPAMPLKQAYPSPDDYFKSGTIGAYRKHRLDPAAGQPVESGDYDIAQQSAFVYVPPAYNGSEPWGIYLHYRLFNEEPAMGLPEWEAVFGRNRLIYACLNNLEVQPVQETRNHLRHICLGLDVLATLRAAYKIDPARIYVGGQTRGAAPATALALNRPDLVRGVIGHDWLDCLGEAPIPDQSGRFWISEHPYLSKDAVRAIAAGGLRFVLLSNRKIEEPPDGNYKHVLHMSQSLHAQGFSYRFFDSPDMPHGNAPAGLLDLAIRWLDGDVVEGYEPDYAAYKIVLPPRPTPKAELDVARKRLAGAAGVKDEDERYRRIDGILRNLPAAAGWAESKPVFPFWFRKGVDQALALSAPVEKYFALSDLTEHPLAKLAAAEDRKRAEKEIGELKKDKAVRDEAAAGKMIEKVRKFETELGANAKKSPDLAAAYRKIAKDHPETRAGREAEKALRRLGL